MGFETLWNENPGKRCFVARLNNQFAIGQIYIALAFLGLMG